MLKKHLIYTTLIIGACFFIQSCKITEQTLESQYREVVGTGTTARIDNETNAILARHQYTIIRGERSNDIYYETGWVPRLTFPDEVIAGVKEVKTRVIIRARPSNRGETTLGGGPIQTYNISFEGQAEYLMNDSTEWQKLPLTQSRSDYFKEIAYKFRTQFSSGGIRN
jgi:hypothetical protein